MRTLILGKYKTHREYCNSPEWQMTRELKWRSTPKERRYCEICYVRYPLTVNHLHYDTVGHEDINHDLNILCRSCNEQLGSGTRRVMRRRLYSIKMWARFGQLDPFGFLANLLLYVIT